MTGQLTAAWRRGNAVLRRFTMYRLVLWCLATLGLIALVLSCFSLVVPGPVELVASAVMLAVVCVGADLAAHRLLGRRGRIESSLITAAILLFVLRPTTDPMGLLGLAMAAAAAVCSKYLLAWRGRHIFNPAAVGASVVTALSALLPLDSGIGSSAWWVGSPVLALPVLILGLVVLARTQKLRLAGVFAVVAVVSGFIRTLVQVQALGLAAEPLDILGQLIGSSPILFLGAFMLSEPLTLPPRRWQQMVVALVVGVGVGWPVQTGLITLGQERALLIGNLVAFLLCLRGGLRLRLLEVRRPSPAVRELVFEARRPPRFAAGQYLELEVPHRHADSRGSRREFSIVSSPEELPVMRIAYRDDSPTRSSYKAALDAHREGDQLWATGVWGDFVLPTDAARPLLLVAGGIGITPFVSQLGHLCATGQERDVVLINLAGDSDRAAFSDEISGSGVRAVVVCRDPELFALPEGWAAVGGRLGSAELQMLVPDLAARDTFISGPPGLIADLTPAVIDSRSVTTDAFSGY